MYDLYKRIEELSGAKLYLIIPKINCTTTFNFYHVIRTQTIDWAHSELQLLLR